jgi:hypothetical protein
MLRVPEYRANHDLTFNIYPLVIQAAMSDQGGVGLAAFGGGLTHRRAASHKVSYAN